MKFLESAAELAETVPQLQLRSGAYNQIARRFADRGASERAREISHINLETIIAIRDESVRSIAFADLSEAYESMGFDLSEQEQSILAELIRKTEWQ
jgi:hypothetical protein